MIPGPIGMVSASVSVVAYVAAGDKKAAVIAAASIAAAAVGAGAAVKVISSARSIAAAAKVGEGAYGLGQAGKITSALAGRMYVGRGAEQIYQGGRKFLQSADGLRMYGGPIGKGINGANGSTANFLRKTAQSSWSHYNRKLASGKVSNGHLTVRRWF